MILLVIIQGKKLADVLLIVIYEIQIYLLRNYPTYLFLMCAKFQNER